MPSISTVPPVQPARFSEATGNWDSQHHLLLLLFPLPQERKIWNSNREPKFTFYLYIFSWVLKLLTILIFKNLQPSSKSPDICITLPFSSRTEFAVWKVQQKQEIHFGWNLKFEFAGILAPCAKGARPHWVDLRVDCKSKCHKLQSAQVQKSKVKAEFGFEIFYPSMVLGRCPRQMRSSRGQDLLKRLENECWCYVWHIYIYTLYIRKI